MKFFRQGVLAAGVVTALVAISRANYLLFHGIAELFSIVISFAIFVIGWNSRKYYSNNYLLFIGIACLSMAFFDTLHTLAYKGMSVFKGYDENNLPPQLWLMARAIEAVSMVLAPLFFTRPLRQGWAMICCVLVSLAGLSAIFLGYFPDCFVTGSGLTPFKVAAEYVIDTILLGALYLLYRHRAHFERAVLRLIACAIVCTMVTEICFTFYVNLYGLSNLMGHLFKIFSVYFMYKAVIETALAQPYDLLFRELKQSEDALRRERNHLQEVLDELKVLRGILPICSYCKKIRSDEGSWTQMEAYIRDHSEAEFSHGICPECSEAVFRSWNRITSTPHETDLRTVPIDALVLKPLKIQQK